MAQLTFEDKVRKIIQQEFDTFHPDHAVEQMVKRITAIHRAIVRNQQRGR